MMLTCLQVVATLHSPKLQDRAKAQHVHESPAHNLPVLASPSHWVACFDAVRSRGCGRTRRVSVISPLLILMRCECCSPMAVQTSAH